MDFLLYQGCLGIISSLMTIPESLELENTHKNLNSFQSLWLKYLYVHHENIIFSYLWSLNVTTKIIIKLHTSYVNILNITIRGFDFLMLCRLVIAYSVIRIWLYIGMLGISV